MKSRFVAVLMAIVGVLLFSTKAIFAKLAYQYGADAITALLLRMLFALPIYTFIAFRLGKNPKKNDTADYWYLLLFGFLGYYLASYLDFKGLEYIKASLERLILFAYPTFVMLISLVFFKKKVTINQLVAIVITYIGIAIVFVPEMEIGDRKTTLIGGVLVLGSALTYGAYIAGSGWLIPKFGPKRFTSYAMIISCLLIMAQYVVEVGSLQPLLDQPSQVYALGFAMAIIATVIPSYIISYAIEGLGANQFSIFGSLGPISTIILAYWFLGESLTMLQFLGGTVVVLGVFTAEYFKSKR